MKNYYCECGNEMNEGEAKTFTCCEVCWDEKYPPEKKSQPLDCRVINFLAKGI